MTKRKTRQNEGRSESQIEEPPAAEALSALPQRRRASPPPPRKPLSPVQRPPSPDPFVVSSSPEDTELHFPARIQARDLAAPRPQVSTKKSIFKSRSKPDPPAPAVNKEASPLRAPEKPAPAPFLEEPRVPLISSSHDLFKAW